MTGVLDVPTHFLPFVSYDPRSARRRLPVARGVHRRRAGIRSAVGVTDARCEQLDDALGIAPGDPVAASPITLPTRQRTALAAQRAHP
jgi:hypothetical protein